MTKYLIPVTSLALVLFLGQATIAQDKTPKDKEKESKGKLNDYDEIIIKKKGEGNGKVTVEIKDGNVIVNGKPIDQYDDDNFSVLKRRVPVFADLSSARSPFRTQGGVWSFSDDDKAGETKAFLGVASEKKADGVTVDEVTEKSAAEKAGLKKGDIITKIDDAVIDSPDELTKIIGKHKPEDKIDITYKRDGKESKTSATLGKRQSVHFNFDNNFNFDYAAPRVEAFPRMDIRPRIESLPHMDDLVFSNGGRPRIGLRAQDTEDGKGVKVVDVEDESAAEKAGIKEDDIITEFDGKAINSVDVLAETARAAREKASVQVKLTRDGKQQTVEIKTPRKLKTANL